MKNIKNIYAYSVEKLKGCNYRVAFINMNGKKVLEITETPRFWLLFIKNIQRAIAQTRLEPVKRSRKTS
ncbi:MAG: hypothetical protein NC938_05995 [Candidatus Omnitrophica bacterium]|nr:hypothetical protein [Candidatus Omnitrophota bacterium]